MLITVREVSSLSHCFAAFNTPRTNRNNLFCRASSVRVHGNPSLTHQSWNLAHLLNPITSSDNSVSQIKLQYNLFSIAQRRNTIFQKALPRSLKFTVRNQGFALNKEEISSDFDWDELDQELEEEEEEEDEGSPWEGAVVYRRNPSVSHLEYCTTLERLGLGKLSTKVSKSRASVMGIRVTKDVKDYPEGTPVLVSLDVTTKKHKVVRLDGIIRTVITLDCNRCGEPAAETIFSNFSLLLSEEPIKEPNTLDMGTMFGSKNFDALEEDDDDSLIDIEDQLYFPLENKTIDISKNIRDLVHIEITLDAICDPQCKGLCLRCGTNLNIHSCKCLEQNVEAKGFSPLGGLRKKMQ
nr:large ribosomal RNA subunit accumulation protein YCED homolog 1, chloroplastic [Ipomoea batatas]